MSHSKQEFAVSIPTINKDRISQYFDKTPPHSASEAVTKLAEIIDGGIEVVAELLEIQTASAKAIAADALVPSEELLVKIGQLSELKGDNADRLFLAAKHSTKQANKNKKLHDILANVTLDTSMESFLLSLLEENNKVRLQWLENDHGIPKSALGRVVHEGTATHIPEKHIAALNSAFGGDTYTEAIIREINSQRKPRRPVDHLLAEYLEDGKSSFKGFIEYVMSVWEIDAFELAKITNTTSAGRFDASKIERQMAANKITDMDTFERWTSGLGFSEKGKYEFQGLARGDASLGCIGNIVNLYKEKMRTAVRDGSENKRWETARALLQKLIERTGMPIHQLPEIAKHVITRGNSLKDPKDLRTRDRIANILIPYDEDLAKSAADILLGIAEVKPAEDLLCDVRNGKIDIQEMVRIRRVDMRMSQSEFCQTVDCVNQEADRKGLPQPSYSAFERKDAGRSLSGTPKSEREALAKHIGLVQPADIESFTELVAQPAKRGPSSTRIA